MCPSPTQWNLRANSICLKENGYTCLLNKTYDKYNENCQGPDIAERGTDCFIVLINKYVISRWQSFELQINSIAQKKSKN